MKDRYVRDRLERPYELDGVPMTFEEAKRRLMDLGNEASDAEMYLRELWREAFYNVTRG